MGRTAVPSSGNWARDILILRLSEPCQGRLWSGCRSQMAQREGRLLQPGDLRVLQAPWPVQRQRGRCRAQEDPWASWGGRQGPSALPAPTQLAAPLAVPGLLVSQPGVRAAGFEFFPC